MAAAANNSLTYWEPGKYPTCKAIGAAVIGSRFVKLVPGGNAVANPGVAQSTADSRVWGIAQNDVPQNERVLVLRDGCHSVTAGVQLAAGDVVYAGAAGVAVKTGTIPAGWCVADTANGAAAPIQLF